MKRLMILAPLCFAACQSAAPDAPYVRQDRATYTAFAPVVARDVAAGHPSTADDYASWRIRLESAEKARGIAPAPAAQP